MTYQYEVGDIVKLKKKHPCGSFEWEILRVGADFRLKCQGCGHQIMVARKIVKCSAKSTCLKRKNMVVLKIVIYNILALYRMSRGPKDHKEVRIA